MDNITRVGIGVAIFKENSVLLGKRKGSHGEGEWAFPGGHLEYMESFQETAKREVEEELGLDIRIANLEVVSLINLTAYAPKHYVDIGMAADWLYGDPIVMEPHKVESWEWFSLRNLPDNLFKTVKPILHAAVGFNSVKVVDKLA